MSRFFYIRLAKENLKKNKASYFPYILTGGCTVAVFYLILSLALNPGLARMSGGDATQMVLQFGTGVVGIFSLIFLFYTNGFLMKRRKKELGLYHILGMDKRNLARLIFTETLMVSLASEVLGLVIGVVMDRLMFWILLKVVGNYTTIRYHFYAPALVITAVIFGIIYLLTLLFNLIQIRKAKPVDLLKSKEVGEKEPKTRLLMALAGAISLGAGYYIAITTKNVMEAFTMFFLAVLLVIVGTYLIFTAGSIAVLKALRWNKGYYYQPKHFISVSGMLYRMKQNAVGLANICILSTGVLLAVSMSVSLYGSLEDIIHSRYPSDISFDMRNDTQNFAGGYRELAEKTAETFGTGIENYMGYASLSFVAGEDGDTFLLNSDRQYLGNDMATLTFLTPEEYTRVTGKEVTVGEGEALLYDPSGTYSADQFSLEGKIYPIRSRLDAFAQDPESAIMLVDRYYFVVNADTMEEIYHEQKAVYQEYCSSYNYRGWFDLAGTSDETEKAFAAAFQEAMTAGYPDSVEGQEAFSYMESRSEELDAIYMLYGGFFFVGIFAGVLFLIATVLIIYYKQISEGYDDRERFVIMRKVGMSDQEIRKTINEQVKKVFFLPLGAAAVHVCAAFPLMKRMLYLLNMNNDKIFVICTAGSVILFGLFYSLVFKITARTYYRIVRQ